MLRSIGIFGFLSAIVFFGWFIGWLFFGMHNGPYHFLVLLAVVLFATQIVLSVNKPRS